MSDIMKRYCQRRYRFTALLAVVLSAVMVQYMAVTAAAAEDFYNWTQDDEAGESGPQEINLDEQITLDFNYDSHYDDYQAAFEGQNVDLCVTGYHYLPFLVSCNFADLKLDMGDDVELFESDDDVDYRAGDISGLTSLAFTDTGNREPELAGTFRTLQHLTVRISGWASSYLGRMGSDQLPVLKTLRIEFSDEDSANDIRFPRGMIFPNTLESIEVLCGGELLTADSVWDSRLLGGFAACCPQATVNGMSISQLAKLPESAGDYEIAKADSRLFALYKSAKSGNAPANYDEVPYREGAVFVSIEEDGIGQNSLDRLKQEESSGSSEDTDYFQDIPEQVLASGIDEAQVAVIIEEELTLVGYYYMGNAYRTTTNLLIMNAQTGELYSSETIAVNDPPETIEVTTINGVQSPKSGYGEFEIQNAVNTVLARIGQVGDADGADGDAQTGVSEQSASAMAPDEDLINRILDVLDSEVYRSTRTLLKNGEVVGSGYRGDAGSGIQQLLVDLGCDITVDGIVGQQTLDSLAQVQQELGLPVTEKADLDTFDTLLPILLLTRDMDAQETSGEDTSGLAQDLQDFYENQGGSGYYSYLQGGAYALSGRYYAAKEAYSSTGYGDAASRAANCIQEWPGTGEVWRNPQVGGSDVSLTFTVNSSSSGSGMCFYMYSDNGTLVSVVFVEGSASATTYVPSGTYRIKDGTGSDWYGRKDAFGRAGIYEFMSFEDESEEDTGDYEDPAAKYKVDLMPGGYELSVNVTEITDDGTGVGGTDVDWDSWVGG